ncbi:MAG: hypothetical protein HKN87_02300 [Saprospiraceae bacterium]|nr:hypothetical protein [Saprospiraceae bacterium]
MKQFPLLMLALLYAGQIGAQFNLNLEAGASFNSKNSVRYPNAESSMGDQVDIPKQFGTGSTLFYRIRASYTINNNNRHTISALYAPLLFETEGTFAEAIHLEKHSSLPTT